MGKPKKKLLIADGTEFNRSVLADAVGKEYDILFARDGAETVKYIRSYGTDLSLVLMNAVMPKISGTEVLEMMNGYKWIRDIPVIVVSFDARSEIAERAFGLGAIDFVTIPFEPKVIACRAKNAIAVYERQKKLLGLIEEQVYKQEKEQSLTINVLGSVVEFRNGESGMHVPHIYAMTEILLQNLLKISDKYKLTPQEISLIATASAMHDVGKISVDEKILNKPGKLTAGEFELVKKHTVYGSDMLEKIPFNRNAPLLGRAKEICRWHHERYDGKGYPDGLRGDAIPIAAQVVGLADAYDALTSDRPYKKAYSHDAAVEMIVNGECGAFNPVLIKALKWAASNIQNELRMSSLSGAGYRDVARITRELVSRGETSVSGRAVELMGRERAKFEFLAESCKDIVFEINAEPRFLSFKDGDAARLGVSPAVTADDAKGALNAAYNGVYGLFGLPDAATAERPEICKDLKLIIDGVEKVCRVRLLAHYAGANCVFDGAVGIIETGD